MSYFFLVPGLICLLLVMHDSDGGVDTAFLSVYLPTLFLLPHRLYDTYPSSTRTIYFCRSA